MARYCEPPARNISFVKTKDYENVLKRAKDHPVIVLTGQNGIGKRWTARQVLRELWKTNNANNKRFHELGINTMDTTKADVDRMLADYGLKEDLELSSCRNVSNLLLRAFQNLDKQCANFHKYCLLDITNLGGEVVANECLSEFIEEFCDELSRNSENRSRWKILVVTVKEKDLKPVKYEAIKPENFYALQGFDIENIKKMIHMECDDYGNEAVDSYARVIHDKLHITLPMTVRLIVTDMDSSIEETPEDFASNYIRSLHPRANCPTDDTATNQHARSLDACKLNLLKCFAGTDLAYRKDFCAMLSLVDGDELPSELLKAFRETLVPEDEKLVTQKVHDLMICLKQADLCKRHQESGRSQVLYRIHPFVQEAMALFMADYTSTKKLTLLKNTLVALVRRMPKDGRDLHPQLIKSFLNIGHKVNDCVKKMLYEFRRDCEEPGLIPLIKILHCELLVAMGYCLITQQNITDGERYFLLALDMYNEAVDSPKSYKHIYEFNKQVVQPLYDKGQRAPFLSEEIFRRYVEDVPRYDVITPNSLHHMPRITSADLANDHMSGLAFDELRKHGRLLVTSPDEAEALVVDIDKSVQVYMGELLVRILASWSKVYASVNGGQGERLEISRYIGLAQQACNICYTIYNTLNVHLLHKLITHRILLRYRLHEANDHDMADDLYNQWNGLHGAPTTSLATTDSESDATEPVSTQPVSAEGSLSAEFSNNGGSESGASQSQAEPEPQMVEVAEQAPAEHVGGGVGVNGQVPMETEVYASGLLRSILEQDQYHQLSCLTWQLLTIGKKRQHSDDPRLYKQQGTKQMDHILELISQLFPSTPRTPQHHAALSKAYRVFAEYHFYCGDIFSAIRNIIRSLEHLRLSSPEGKLDPMSVHYTHLMHDYDKYRGQCATSLQPFVGGEEEVAGYLLNIIDNLKAVRGQNQAGEGPYKGLFHHIRNEIVAVERVETQSHEVSEHSVDEQSGATGVQDAAAAYRSQPMDSESYYSQDEDSNNY